MTHQKILSLLDNFLMIQSVSTDPNRFKEIEKAVIFLKDQLINLGADIKIVGDHQKPPLIIGYLKALKVSKKTKTIGIYGHYDVQPEDPMEKWHSPPFKLTLKNGKIFGRGVADNKGHIIQNLISINRLIEKKQLNHNIVFIFEGEEETGSVHFEEYIKRVRDLLKKIDLFFLTDMGMHQKNSPQIFYGLRGIAFFELIIRIGERDLHSGVYGNAVYNPIQILANLIAKIKDLTTGQILIHHFYDDVRKFSSKEINELKKTLKPVNQEKKEAQVDLFFPSKKLPPSLAAKILPSFDVNGIFSGYTGPGSKTIIPASALAKFSFRLVENQNPQRIKELVERFIEKNIPKGINYQLNFLGGSSPFYCQINDPVIQKVSQILTQVFGQPCLFNRSGGSIPAAEILSRLFKKPVILTGFTLPDDNIHAPNENFDAEMFFKGIEALEKIYSTEF